MIMDLESLLSLITNVDTYAGYAGTGATLPYVVARPLFLGPDGLALDGGALSWDNRITLYCCAGGVQACDNLTRSVLWVIHGSRIGDSVLSASVGYFSSQVDGHYESQITVQTNQGDIQ